MSSSPNKPVLKLDWCSHEAARWAVEHWHYSKSMPTPPVVKIGVWEDERFIGVVLFSRGAILERVSYNDSFCFTCDLMKSVKRYLESVSIERWEAPLISCKQSLLPQLQTKGCAISHSVEG